MNKFALPVLLLALALVAGMGVGASQAANFPIPAGLFNLDHLDQGFVDGAGTFQFFSPSGIGLVWMHNLRALILATVLGVFSFGVLGVVILMIPLMLVGYFMATMATAGIPALDFLVALVLPHGILEIPAIILAGAAILRLGATLAAPAQGQTIGEAWLRALADWAKIMLGVVAPLLLGAAILEVMVTPRIALWILGG